MATSTWLLDREFNKYYKKISANEPAHLQALRKLTAKLTDVAIMQISPEQGQLFHFLIRLMGARRTLDIGTFTGYSAAVVAGALPPNGRVHTFDVNDTWTAYAEQSWATAGLSHKIIQHMGPARIALEKLLVAGEQNTFDFAFIDADKINQENYYEACLQLVRVGGVIAIDNVFFHGEVANSAIQTKRVNVIRQLNDKIRLDPRVDFCVLPIGDGVTLVHVKECKNG